jgi:AraC-like DNA-binding protein
LHFELESARHKGNQKMRDELEEPLPPPQVAEQPLSRLLFATDELAPEARFNALATELGTLFDLDAPVEHRRQAQGSLDGHLVGEMVAGLASFSPVRFNRSEARIAKDDLDHCLVQLYMRGGFGGDADGREMAVKAGDICIFDLTRPLNTSAVASSVYSLILPRSLLQSNWQGIVPHGEHLPAGSVLGRILADHLRTLHRLLPTATAADVPILNETSVALVAAALSDIARRNEGAQSRSLLQVERRRVLHYIDRHLADPELTPEKLCQALGVSRAQLYRLFQGEGGVQRHIMRQRLRLAFKQLLHPVSHRLPIHAIAYRCGFRSDSHFSRAFRQHFGVTPREAREEGFLTGMRNASTSLTSWLVGEGRV